MSNKLCAERYNDELYIAFNEGTGIEWYYVFKKCMHNELFTFKRVGYRAVDREYSDTINFSLNSITTLNNVDSDNIGPIGIYNYRWVGGAHSWLENHITKTAVCNSFSIKFDDTDITTNAKTLCNKVTVNVVNTIFDPSAEQPSDTPPEILTTPLAIEYVTYVISKNSIEVTVNHQFVGGVGLKISRYYGMQSVFKNENAIFTVGKTYNNEYGFVADLSTGRSFNKSDCPNFNRFIEKQDNGYQSAYLKSTDIGDHSLLADSSRIFVREGNKCYHSLIFKPETSGQLVEITDGMHYSWSGVYTWFKQLGSGSLPIDDDDLLVYSGVINGKDVLYIDAKRACNRIVNLPDGFDRGRINYLQSDSNMSIALNGTQISISTNGIASSIIYSRIPGDVNDDGVIDIDDIHAVIQMIMGNRDYDPIADLNGDGIIDIDDLNLITQSIV